MLKVYFTAATSFNHELSFDYKNILLLIQQNKNCEILSGNQIINEDLLNKDRSLNPKEIFIRETKLIDDSDFLIAEASRPSLGVGSEIVHALLHNKPVLVLVRTDYEDKISPLIAGNTSNNLYIEYYRKDNIGKVINKFITNIIKLLRYSSRLREKKGKLIVIEGSDGSGKTVQSALLCDYLKKNHFLFQYFDFPQYYNSFHGETIAKFLRGEFGKVDQVSPYLISLAYSLDRASVKTLMENVLDKGGFAVANRYATSNMAHQGSKFTDENEKNKFLNWVYDLEYKVNGIPKEDIVFYLYVPWKMGDQLSQQKGERKYLKGKKNDIHEKSLSHRLGTEKMYLELAKKNKNWIKINCVQKNKLLTPEEIHNIILSILKKKHYLTKS